MNNKNYQIFKILSFLSKFNFNKFILMNYKNKIWISNSKV